MSGKQHLNDGIVNKATQILNARSKQANVREGYLAQTQGGG